VCGDGLVQAPEECDDGNDVSSDACTRTCTIAKCGDGSVWKDKEECDGTFGCTADCRAQPHELTLGMRHSCVRYHDGDLKCWGDNTVGQVGDTRDMAVGDEPSDLGENLETLLRDVDSVSAGAFHTCALRDGAVLCWGDNRYNQLGPSESGSFSARPVQVEVGGTARDVCATAYSSFARLADGTVRGWGLSYANDERGVQTVPFSEDLSVSSIACGDNAVCGHSSGGDVECWGDAALLAGQPEPLKISLRGRDLTRLAQLAIGATHGCAYYESSVVRCWGSNGYGQLLEGDTLDRPGDLPADEAWHPIQEGMSPTSIASGGGVSCAIGRRDTETQVKCWGFDSRSGALGQPQLTGSSFNPVGDAPNEIGESLFPIPLGDGDEPRTVATSGYHTCVILQNGRVKCWGYNEFGQLGIGTTDWAIGDQAGELGNALRYSAID
jgi:cysteine-rich repeat protein